MGLEIIPQWDASVLSQSQAFQSEYETAVNAAISYYEQTFSNNVTLTIDFGWGEENGSLIFGNTVGENEPNGQWVSYAVLLQALAGNAASANQLAAVAALPSTDPTNGGYFRLTNAEAKALGSVIPPIGNSVDGHVGLNSSDTYTFDPANRSVPGAFDAIGALEHEISEVMGRIGYLGEQGRIDNGGFFPTVGSQYGPMDLFRYGSTGHPGQPDLTSDVGFFSVNGDTLLTEFNNPAVNGGDAADWDLSTVRGDSFGGASRGTAGLVTQTDLTVMNLLGWNLAAGAAASSAVIISSTQANQSVLDGATISPFAHVTISDTTPGLTQTVTITLSAAANGTLSNIAGGSYNAATGVFTVSGSASTVSTVLDELVFTPAQSSAPQGQTTTTNFTIRASDSTGAATTDSTTSVVAVSTGSTGSQNLKSETEAVGATFFDTGTIKVNGTPVTWSGSINVVGPPANVPWAAYSGTMAQEILTAQKGATNAGSTQFTNATLTALGAPFSADGLAVWGNPNGVQAGFFALDTIKYTFSSPLPAGTAFMLWAPGGSAQGDNGPFEFIFSGSLNGVSVPLGGWTFSVQNPFNATPVATYSTNSFLGQVTVSNVGSAQFPDAVIVATTSTAVNSIQIAADTLPYDFWGFALPASTGSALAGNNALLWQNDSGAASLWLMNGNTAIGGGSLGNPGSTWHIMGSGDFNGDGQADIIWQNNDGTTSMWLMNGTSVIGGGSLGNPGASWHVVATGDFNGDGKSDIVWQSDSGATSIWEMNGSTAIAGGSLGNPGTGWHVVGTGDFNGDGKSDIVWQNDNGAASIWEMNGTSVIGGGSLGNPGAGWYIVGTGDFNGDGKSDILWQNASGAVSVWLMNGTTAIGGGTVANPGPSWHVAGTGDFNGDGKSDIAWQNDDGTVSIWEMNGNVAIGGGTVTNAGPSWHVIGNDSLRFINGTTGNATLNATPQSDNFLFTSFTAGAHAISGFDIAQDIVTLSAAQFANFAAVQAATTASGGGALIALGGSDTLLLQGVAPSALQARDFRFV